MSASLTALAVAAASTAMAAENSQQRYSPGIGGTDMTTPLIPGWYFQAPAVAYHASKLRGNDGKQATKATIQGGPRAAIEIDTDTYAVQPRLTMVSNQTLWGANLGFTVMLPIVQRKGDFKFTLSPGQVAALGSYATAVQGQLVGGANRISGTVTGLADLELGPLLHWELADNQSLTVVPTIVVPTGEYKAERRLNPGYGNYYTFRPSAQYAYIGDGWDFGVRGVLSFNTRNKDTGYRSGNMFNVDFQLMKFVSDDVRVGLQGYHLTQFTKDSQDVSTLAGWNASDRAVVEAEIVNGNKMRATALGPAVGWLRNGGDFLLEGKFLKEFSVRNRTEGHAFWLTFSKPL